MSQRTTAVRSRLHNLFQSQPSQMAIRRDVLRLAVPAMGEQMLSMMVGVVDTYLVGHLGAASLAAVGLANQWIFMAAVLFAAIATGGTALIARSVGAKDIDQANEALRQAILMGVGIGLLATLLGQVFATPAVALFGAEPDVAALGSSYLRIVASIFLLSTLMFVGNACLRGAGDTRTPLMVMLVVNVLNIVVSWTAINGPFGLPQLGVAGSALGAAAGRFVGGVLVIALLLKGRSGIQLKLRGLRPDLDMIRRLLRVGLPTGAEHLLMRTGQMAFSRIVAGLGTATFAASQVAVNGWSLSFMPGFGFALAATTLVGQSLGAGNPDGAERRGLTAYRMGGLLMSTIGLAFIFLPAQIMGFFTDDPQVIALGTMPLRMVGLAQPIMAATMIFGGSLRGAGDTRFPMVVSGISIWLIRVPLSYGFAHVAGWGLLGAWLAFIFDVSIRGLLNYRRFRGGKWKKVKV